MIYVDELTPCPVSKRWRWHNSSHLFTLPPDRPGMTTELALEELHRFAFRLGLRRAWFQNDSRLPHYDLNPSRHAAALAQGARKVSRRFIVDAMNKWRALGK